MADDGCVTADDVLAANESNHVALRTPGIGHVTGVDTAIERRPLRP
jgi:hypothetical protein